jgi:hypothetical protein
MSEAAREPKVKRQWYQSRLWTLMLFATGMCLAVGCAIWYLRPVIDFKNAAFQMRERAAPAPKGNPWLGPFMTTEVDYSESATRLPEDLLAQCAATLAGDSKYLEALPNLRVLILRGLPVHDDDLQYLQALTDLKELDLRGTQVTDEGVAKLQRSLPDCKIHH